MEKMLVLLTHSRLVTFLINFSLAALWTVFIVRHVRYFNSSGDYALILFTFSETLQAFFFLVRRNPQTVSTDPFDWLIAGGGTFLPLFLRPGGSVLWQGGDALVILAVTFQALALLSLNRSFAIVAAKRTVKTSGLYRIVRHPMYASYLFLYSGYLLHNVSFINIILIILSIAFLFLRLVQEEKHLSIDATYRAYKERVCWRLVPFVY